MVGFGESYFAPYAISLGASNFLVGLLASLPLLAGSLMQLGTPTLIHSFGSRRRLLTTGVFLQALCFMPIILVSKLVRDAPTFFLLIAIAYWIFHLSINPAWQSWMGDLVASDKRGHFFSLRNRWVQLSTFGSLVAAGWLLHLYGFSLIFLIAMIGRFLSLSFLARQEEPPYRAPSESQFTLMQFVRKMRFNNYGLFVIYVSLLNLVAHIAAPYFVPYVFRELKFSYLQFMLYLAVFVASKSLFLPVWGRYADRYGVRKLLSLAGYLVPLLTVPWLFTRNYWLLLCFHAFSGFCWAGFELCAFNFILDFTTPERRTRCAVYYQLFNGIGTVIGSLMGGVLLLWGPVFTVPYYLVFFLSAIGRWLVSRIFLPKIREIRVVEKISYRTLFVRMLFFMKPGPE